MSKSEPIIFHHIRNATSKLTYSGLKILIDPFLTPKEYYPGFELGPTLEIKKARIPLNDLPLPIEEIVKDIDMVIITHLHYDHWDEYTSKYILKNTPIFVQNLGDKKRIQAQGFTDIRVLGINTPFKGITITKTFCQHGCDDMLRMPIMAERCGDSMGFIFQAPGLKKVYFSGDTIWHEFIELTLNKHKPEILVLNAPSGRYDGFKGTTMLEPEDVKKCYELYTDAKIITVHMNSFPHCITTTEKMKKFVEENKLQDRVFVPEDGEILKF